VCRSYLQVRYEGGCNIWKAIPSPPKKRLVILDLNHVLCDIMYVAATVVLPRESYVHVGDEMQYQKPALVTAESKKSRRLVTARFHVRHFLEKLCSVAYVGIWTCMARDMASPIVSWLFGDSSPDFVLSQEHCTTLKNDSGNLFRSRAGASPQFFKELPLFWKMEWGIRLRNFIPSEENTVLVDDSPLKCFLNPPGNCIFPIAWNSSDAGNSDVEKDLKILFSICDGRLSVPGFVSTFLEGESRRIFGDDPIRPNSRVAKMIELYPHYLRPVNSILARSRCRNPH
jgi:hypothetical protein